MVGGAELEGTQVAVLEIDDEIFSNYGNRSLILKPNNKEAKYSIKIDLEEMDWKAVTFFSSPTPESQYITARIGGPDWFSNFSISGKDYISIDKNFDGFIDVRTELAGGYKVAKTTIFTDEQQIDGVLGIPFKDPNNGKEFNYRWRDGEWKRIYKDS